MTHSVINTIKACTKCTQEKPLSEFYRAKKSSDGHQSWCKGCSFSNNKKWIAERPDVALAYVAKWRKKNRGRVSQKEKEYRQKYYEKYREREKNRFEKNRLSEDFYKQQRESRRKYNKRYPEKRRYQVTKRRADKLKRTPKWADLNKIKQFYKDCPKGMEVDHIVPLKGKVVSGLHVHNNLQYLPRIENIRKGNRFELCLKAS